MAEFALGLAKTAVAGTVSRAKSAIDEEKKLRVSVKDDLVFITGEFEMLQSFLSASNTGDRASKNLVGRTWVRQLRELAFDVEDCVEFMIHLDKESWWDYVRRFASPVRECFRRPPLPLDVAAEEIKRLKVRVEDVSQRNNRYNLIPGHSAPADAHHQLTPYVNTGSSKASSGTLQVLLEVWKTTGRFGSHTAIDLKKLIDSDVRELQVISLWRVGSADAADDAPTSLSNYVHTLMMLYKDPVICQRFQNRAWVKLSVLRPFNPVEFLNNIFNQFRSCHHHHEDGGHNDGDHENIANWSTISELRYLLNQFRSRQHHHEVDGDHHNHANADSTISEILQKLRKLRYLVVLEQEINTIADWAAIRMYLPAGNEGSRVVVSTNSLGIALLCTGDTYQVSELQRFSHEQGLYAFFPKEQGPIGDAGGPVIMITEEEDESALYAQLAGRGYVDHSFHFSILTRGWTLSMWGIAGVGKTYLARKMYKLHGLKYARCGWVDVPYPFDLTELCRRLLRQLLHDGVGLGFHSAALGAMESAAISMTEGQDPLQWCCKILRQNRCLVVFDGLRFTHDWDVVKATLLSQPTAGNTVVITREESIATYCTEERERMTWNVTGLKEDAAILLFEEIALGSKKLSKLDTEDQKHCKVLVSNCGGLPQVIAATAKSVHTNGLRFAKELNSDFIRILQTSSLYTSLRGLFSWMHSYFDALSDELKPCIFYMLVFPADKSIRWRRLLSRWIAEGYLPGGSSCTLEVKGGKVLQELMKLSILYSEQKQKRISSCKVNGFFRDYIKSSPMEDNLVLALEESRSTSSLITAQHLTIRESWKRDSYKFNMMEVSRLRSLTVSGVWESFLISDKMKVLRVLDLEGTSTELGASVTDNDLEKIVKEFRRLKFLSLRGCIRITRLPDSLGEIRQLQTLDVKDTSIVKLLASITKLEKLQYIRAGTTTDRCTLLVQPKASTPPPSPPTPQPSAHPSTAPTPQEDGHADTNPFVQGAAAAAAEYVISTKEAWQRKAADLVESSRKNWWKLKNKKNLRSRQHLYQNGGGVEFVGAAEGIERLIHLHTLRVVNVAGGKGGLVFLKELKKLAQLRKLGLSGINAGNWSMLCDAVRGELNHLESLSLQLEKFKGSYEFACFDDHFQPPKSLKRLKVLYTSEGQVASIGPAWINKLPNLERFDHELTVSTQGDICVLTEKGLIPKVGPWCLRIKPIVEHLSFGPQWDEAVLLYIKHVSVECSSNSKVTFTESVRLFYLSTMSIHCCCSTSAAGSTSTAASSSCGLEIAGLLNLENLTQVTVTGTYADDLKLKFATQIEDVERRATQDDDYYSIYSSE